MKNRSGNCKMCGTFREVLHRDHIVPRAIGGSNELSNIQLICANCHQDKTKEDLKLMNVGERCKKGRAKALLSLSESQIKARKEQLRSNGRKAAEFFKALTEEQRSEHGKKIKSGYLKMSDEAKNLLRIKLRENALKGAIASKLARDNMNHDEKQSFVKIFSDKAKEWHQGLSGDEKVQWNKKIKSGIQKESAESRNNRINGAKKAASRFALMTDSEKKEWGAKCLAGRRRKESEEIRNN